MSSLPAALAMMSPGAVRRPGVRSEAETTAAREPAAIGAPVPAALGVPAVHEGHAPLVGAGHSATTGGSTRGLTAPSGWPGAGRTGTASEAARC